MRMNSKKTIFSAVGAVAILSFFSTVIIFAQTGTPKAAGTQASKNFCQRVSEFSSRIDQKITEQNVKLEAKRNETANKISSRRQERTSNLAEIRTKWDESRTEHFQKLREKAETDAQKQALIQFKEAVNSAISTRRAAVDAANSGFQQGVDQAITARKIAADAAVANFRNSVKAAWDKAKTDCASGVNTATVRQNLKSALKSAREKFVSDKQAVEKLRDSMKNLIQTRKQAIEKANQDFKAAMEKAKDDLKAVFPKNGE